MTLKDGFINVEVEEYGPFSGIFGSNKNVELLQLLLSIPDLKMNKSQLSDVLGISYKTTSKILKHLEKLGIVYRSNEGNGHELIFRLNRNSPAISLLDSLDLTLTSVQEPSIIPLLQHKKENSNSIPMLSLIAINISNYPFIPNNEFAQSLIIIEPNFEETGKEIIQPTFDSTASLKNILQGEVND